MQTRLAAEFSDTRAGREAEEKGGESRGQENPGNLQHDLPSGVLPTA